MMKKLFLLSLISVIGLTGNAFESYREAYNAALSAQQKKDYDGAVTNFNEAAVLAKNSNDKSQALTNAGRLLMTRRKFEEAIQKYQEILAIEGVAAKSQAAAYVGIGSCRYYQKKYAEGIESFENILKIENVPESQVKSACTWIVKSVVLGGKSSSELYEKGINACDKALEIKLLDEKSKQFFTAKKEEFGGTKK